MRSARSSEIRQATGALRGTYGSKTSEYTSTGSSSRANRSRSSSTSGSGPTSGSYRSSGTMSSCAPRRPPVSSSWETSSSRNGTALSGSSPLATSVTATMKLSIESEI